MIDDHLPTTKNPLSKTTPDKLVFTYLPAYARYLRDEHLEDFVKESLRICRKVDLPLLRLFEPMGEAYLIELSRQSNYELFTSIAENRVMEQLRADNHRWVTDQLPVIGKFEIKAEDITMASYIRRLALRKFLPSYPPYAAHGPELLDEIDEFLLAADTLATDTYISLLKDRINEEVHFNEKITGTSPGIIYVYDIQERKQIYTNRQVETLLGYTHEELQQMGEAEFALIQHPDDQHRALEHMDQFAGALDGQILTFEHRLKDKTGRYRWLRNYESVFKRSSDSAPQEIIGISLDITDEKKNEEELIQRQEQLLEAQALAELGSFEWNIGTGAVSGSPQFYRIFGIGPGEQRKDMLSRVHPADRAAVDAEMSRALNESGLYNCEYRYLGADKEKVVWVRGKIENRQGENYMKGTAMDVTERHALVSRLQASEELYKKAEAMSHIGNWEWDKVNNKFYWSDELYRIYGLEPQSQEMTYESIASFNHPDDVPLVRAQMRDLVTTHRPNDFIYRIILKDGSAKTLYAKAELKLDKAGQPQKVFGTLQDVTRQVESEISLQQKNLQLKQSNASLEEFAFVASHDLREPLRKIVTFGGMLQKKSGDMETDSQMYLTKIIDSAKRMQLMIDDLLSLSLISGNKLFEKYSLQAILDEVMQTLEYRIESSEARIEARELPDARIIPAQFRQVFQNIISNSLKFARQEVPLVLRIRADYLKPKEKEELGLPKGRSWLKLSFQDNGIGFDNRYAEKIFVMFQRLHGKSEFEGNGIGLAICRKIIENHEGLLFATGIPDEGATFTIVLPA